MRITQQEKILLGALAAVGLLWAWSRTRAGQDMVAPSVEGAIDFSSRVVEYAETKAADVIGRAQDFVSNLRRGERNNNPGNIRRSADNWQGLAAEQSDPSFFVFADPVSGIRALAKTLRTYQDRYGLSSITQLISRWAPNHENPTGNYISNVSRTTGYNSNAGLDLNDEDTLVSLASAIIQQENGRIIYPPSVIAAGVSQALA